MSDILKLGLLLREVGPVEGRKKLQKIVHLLQESGVDFDTQYELSLYGPYSAELKGCIDELVATNLIQESATGSTYRYSMTDAFVSVLQKVASHEPPKWSTFARELNERDASELEGISTVVFLRSRGWNNPELGVRFKSLKPHLSERLDEFLNAEEKIRLADGR